MEAVIDTGSEVTILDRLIAVQLGLDLGNRSRFNLRGFGGRIPLLGPTAVEIDILGLPELTARVMAFFSENFVENFGNLLGLDVLESIDIGLSHRDRLLYFGLPR